MMKRKIKIWIGILFAITAIGGCNEYLIQTNLAKIYDANLGLFQSRRANCSIGIWYFARPYLGISNAKYAQVVDELNLDQGGTGFGTHKMGFLIYKYFTSHEVDSILDQSKGGSLIGSPKPCK